MSEALSFIRRIGPNLAVCFLAGFYAFIIEVPASSTQAECRTEDE